MATFVGSWAQAAAGDSDVFAMFYERHTNQVFAHCYRRVGSRLDAEDLTSQVFEIAWRRRADVHYDEDADILPWLLATANNLVSDHHRASAKVRRLMSQLPPIEHEPDLAATLAERDGPDHEIEIALSVLRSLRHGDREVIELCVMDGLPPTVAARARGIPASTMRNRLARALIRARRMYHSSTRQPAGCAGGTDAAGWPYAVSS